MCRKLKRYRLCLSILLLFPLLFLKTTAVHAVEGMDVPEDDTFYLVDFAGGEQIDNFLTLREARNAFEEYEEDYENLGIMENGTVYMAEHAIVLFATSDGCDVNVTYENAIDGETGFTNGCYGKDAAFLDVDSEGENIEFMLSGVSGWAAMTDVEVVPIENIQVRLTGYTIDSGILYHGVKSSMDDNNYASIINGGTAPSYLEEGKNYYSYDGHYFYAEEDLTLMLEDYRNDTREHSLNPDDPHYDYYQYVSHRSMTTATVEQLRDYIENTMGVTGPINNYIDNDKDQVDDTLTRSQLYGTENAFFHYQYEYGSNALMMFAIAASESSYGHTSLSYNRNNLYGHAAYDADTEAESSRYLRIANSIYSHAKYYISGSYSSPLKAEYHGSFFGNKSAGMNVSYSSDPYWGEKAAAYYRSLDQQLGGTDENSYTIGIKTSDELIYVYQYPEEGSKALYSSGENSDAAFTILAEISNEAGDWYKVQAEATLDSDSQVDLSYEYDFANNLGYIKAEDVDVILEGKGEAEPSYVHVTFNADGGTFTSGADTVTYAMASGSTACCDEPQKNGALFTGWDVSTEGITSDTVFTAQWKAVDHIELIQMPQQDYELYDRINLKDGLLSVVFTDGTSEEVGLTTSMVSGFNSEAAGTVDVQVTWAGYTISYPVEISAEKDALRTEIKEEILDVIDRYEEKEEFTEEEQTEILDLKQKIEENMLPYLTQTQLRSFDRILRNVIGDRIRYIVEDNDFGLGISGLSVSIPIMDSLSKNNLSSDTYRVTITQGVSEEGEEKLVREGNFLESVTHDCFTLAITKNYESYELNGPVLFTVNKPENAAEGDVFTVLYYNPEDGTVEKCYTRQTDQTVSFIGSRNGEYMLLSRRTSNAYRGDDPEEAVTAESASFDLQNLLVKIAVGLCIFLLLIILLRILYAILHPKYVRHKREVKKRKAADEPAAPVDFTEAMYIFETQVLNVSDIEAAGEELENGNTSYDAREEIPQLDGDGEETLEDSEDAGADISNSKPLDLAHVWEITGKKRKKASVYTLVDGQMWVNQETTRINVVEDNDNEESDDSEDLV